MPPSARADQGRGVACLYGNYAGDNMNVKMAIKLAAKDGIERRDRGRERRLRLRPRPTSRSTAAASPARS